MSLLQQSRFQTRRLKFLLRSNDGGAWGDDPDGSEQGHPVLRSTDQTVDGKWAITDPAIRNLSHSDFFKTRLFEGDLLITKSSGSEEHIGKTTVVTKEVEALAAGYSNFMQRLHPNGNLNSRFLAHVLNSDVGRDQFRLLATTTTGLGNLSAEIISELEIPLPTPDQQRAIAEYLDRETGRLDGLVALKERWLALLAEKRRALITRAVTCGLNPQAPLRDSGLPWLGQIPKHWDIERAKWLFKERDERSVTGDEELLTVSHITGVTPRSEKEVSMFEAETTEGYKICMQGDLVINTLWAWMGAMGVSPVHGIVSPAYNVYAPCERLEPGYVDALVRIPAFAEEATRYSKGVWSSRLRLYPEGLYEIWFPVPPLAEQRAIVTHIGAETAKLDGLRAATERTIALLKERRAALIAAAVTGKIDVPETGCQTTIVARERRPQPCV